MAKPQSEFAASLAKDFDLDLIKFRHCDALVFKDSEILKLFVPRSTRAIGGASQNRMIGGDLMFVPRNSLKELRPPSEKYEMPDDDFGCPIYNFPWLVGFSQDNPRRGERDLRDSLMAVFQALPDDRDGWWEAFGDLFFDLQRMDKLRLIVGSLRESRPGS